MFIINSYRFAVSGGEAWTPSELTTALWLDASVASSITENESVPGNVAQWSDLSGGGNHVTQTTNALQPLTNTDTLNSKNVITFNDDRMTVTFPSVLSQPNSIFIVFKSNLTNNVFVYGGVDSSNRHAFFLGDISTDYSAFAGSILAGSNSDTNTHIIGSIYNSTNSEIYIDGTSDVIGDAGAQGMSGITLGDRYTQLGNIRLNGYIAEIVVVNEIPSESDRQKIEGYLAWKWGLTASLPVAHPYKYDGSLFGYTTWTPLNIAKSLWLDASDASSITENISVPGSVAQWGDLSGNGNHAVQANGSDQPVTNTRTLNGLNVIDFDGTNHFMSLSSLFQPGSNDSMILAVINSDESSADSGRIINGQDGLGTRFGLMHQTSNLLYVHNSSFSYTFTTYQSGAKLQGGYKNGSSLGVGYDGDTYTENNDTATCPTLDNIYIGCYNSNTDFLNGAIAEIIVVLDYNESDRQKLEGYLAHKWGLTANLPVGHPYKSVAPTL